MGRGQRQGGPVFDVGQFRLPGVLLNALLPVGDKLKAPLATIFRDENRPETQRMQAADILTNYASDDPNLLADLLMDANPKAYATLFPVVERQATKTLPMFRAEIKKTALPDGSGEVAEEQKDRLAMRQARAAGGGI